MYNFELDTVIKEIEKRNAKKVLLQLPDGLRPYAFQLANKIREIKKIEVILLGDSCYGACDIAIRQAKELEVDLLIHYGHNLMLDFDFPILYINAEINLDIEKLIEIVLPKIEGIGNIGLVTTIQHVHQIKDFADALKAKGINIKVGKGDNKRLYDGQILGCNYQVAKSLIKEVNCFIFLGGGEFHPIGLSITTGKPVLIVNPYNLKTYFLDDSEIMLLAKKRYASITKAKNAKNIGILVSSKPGQNSLNDAQKLVKKITGKNIISFIIYMDEIKQDTLNNFSEAEIFVDTACPRIAIDGIAGVEKPILTIQEMLVALGELEWEKIWGSNYISLKYQSVY
ncbi:diphthamide biosynthesis enzyme Dph2 [Candidatus Bathyarchaeota archaeon]|nr:diphthamide biosynthesis enzyme Dph2 [Candidatus Bathyarchaeota archaeon]